MPQYSQKGPVATYKVTDYVSPSLSDVYGTLHIQQRDWFRTTSVRRAKPVDLFASATAYHHWDVKRQMITPASRYLFDYEHSRWTYWWGPHTAVLPSQSFPAMDSSLKGFLRTKALLAIKDQKVNLSVSIMELPKTASMVGKMAIDTLRFLRSLRRGDLRQLIRAVKGSPHKLNKATASRWLQYQYGVIPTVLEANGVLELLSQKVRRGVWIYGHVTDRREYSRDVIVDYQTTRKDYVSLRGKCNYRYFVQESKLAMLSQSGITNPLATAYELVPYSFVLDWFINVGDYISTLDALVGISSVEAIYSWKEITEGTSSMNPYGTGKPLHGGAPGTGTIRIVRSARHPREIGIKPFRPQYQPHLSVKRLISAVALIRNLFK